MEARAVGTKLRPKASTSVSTSDSWWEEISYGFIFKLVCSSWRIQHLINLKIFVVHVSETSFLHECLSMVT